MFKIVSAKQGSTVLKQIETILDHYLIEHGWRNIDGWYYKADTMNRTIHEALELQHIDELEILRTRPTDPPPADSHKPPHDWTAADHLAAANLATKQKP